MSFKIVECPRDAMQGFHNFISTEDKIEYINALIEVGFDSLDCGSFVSAKSIPQLADTATVLNSINDSGNTKLLVIAANERGANEASNFKNVDIIGFPFSISETFQLRNTNQNFNQATKTLIGISNICQQNSKELLVYLSMGFGNPYNEDWSVDIAFKWCQKLSDLGVKYINLSDTVGRATAQDIHQLFSLCLSNLPHIEFGAHFHTRPDNYLENITAAYDAGCQKFDAAIKGFGGCPFATDKLTGNLPTENLIDFLKTKSINHHLNLEAFHVAFNKATSVFI